MFNIPRGKKILPRWKKIIPQTQENHPSTDVHHPSMEENHPPTDVQHPPMEENPPPKEENLAYFVQNAEKREKYRRTEQMYPIVKEITTNKCRIQRAGSRVKIKITLHFAFCVMQNLNRRHERLESGARIMRQKSVRKATGKKQGSGNKE